jgi:outer membrane protein assembly factor BamD (BamD/ComL family)
MRISKNFLILSAFVVLLAGASFCHAAEDDAYVIEEKGRSTWRVLFDRKKDSSAEQWAYAQATRSKGWLKKADRRMLYLVRRWPNSKEAPLAQRARGDMLYSRGKLKEAFSAYQFLIDNYSSRMQDYDSVLENQFGIAVDIMNHRRMRWIFGGYRAAEYAVDYFETVIRNGPQWDRAPEAQYLIGKCHQDADDLELAISAYGVLGYRYPDSNFSEEGAWQQIVCMQALHEEYPSHVELLDRILTSTTVFLSGYPQSKYRNDIIQLRNRLYEVKAGMTFDEAAFYAKVPKEPKAAILYYQKMIEEFPKSRLVPEAKERIAELERLMALPKDATKPRPMRSRPLPFGKDASDAES